MPTIENTVKRPGHYLVREDERLSRSNVVITGGSYIAGEVMGKITASGKYVPVNAGAADGSENFAGILFANVDATAEDVHHVVHNYHSEVRKDALKWPDGATQGQIDNWLAQMEAQHIKAR